MTTQEEYLEGIKRLAPQVRIIEKHLQVDLDEIISRLKKEGEYERQFTVYVDDEDVEAKLNISAMNLRKPNVWRMSLKIFQQRIDGIGFMIAHGGWHRHDWSAENLDKGKIPPPELDQLMRDKASATIENFIAKALSFINITLSKGEKEVSS